MQQQLQVQFDDDKKE